MDKTLKQRLIGAAVIIALAVIFIPMLLEGPRNDDPVTMKIDIPDKPVYEIPGRLETPPTPETVIIPPTVRTPDTAGETTDVAVPEPVQEAAPPKAEPEVVEKPKVVEPETPVAIAPPVSKPEPVVKKPEIKPEVVSKSGFVVQVGSFSQRQNALVLSDKLEASGYPAFVESGKSNSKSIYRVKVGPKATRSGADQLRQKLLDNEKLKGIIVAHP